MLIPWTRIAVILAGSTLLFGAPPILAHDHEHSPEAAAPARLTLDHGHKWATDVSLRQGMSDVREALANELPTIRSGAASAERYRALSLKIGERIAFMVGHCRLEPDADAMLHIVLAEIIAGTDALAQPDRNAARDGAERIARALDDYGRYFDHPGW